MDLTPLYSQCPSRRQAWRLRQPSARRGLTEPIHCVRLNGGYPMASTHSSFPRLDCLATSMRHATLPTLCPPQAPMNGNSTSGALTTTLATCRGQHRRVRAACGSGQGKVAKVSLHLHLCLCRHLVAPRSSATPGLTRLQTRYRLRKLCRPIVQVERNAKLV